MDRGRRLPKEVAVRAGHISTSFVLDRYGHLFPESDAALRDRLDQLFVPATEQRRNATAESAIGRRNRMAPCALSWRDVGVEVRGFEPLASSVRGRRSAGLSYTPG